MNLYSALVQQSRKPLFYEKLAVPDTPDGRYDMIMIHAFLLLHRLKRDRHATKDISQAVFDIMFQDMDKNLREMGAGDVGVSHRIKDMAKAFYGRIAAYEKGLIEADGHLKDAVRRNVYRNCSVDNKTVRQLCSYIRNEVASLNAQPTSALLDGKLVFSNPSHIFCT